MSPRRARRVVCAAALACVTAVAGACGGTPVQPWSFPPAPPAGLAGSRPPSEAVAAATAAPVGNLGPAAVTGTPAPSTARAPTAKFGFRAKGLSDEVLGFVQAGDIGYALDRLDYSVVSTVAFFSLVGLADGSIDRSDSNWQIWTSPAMDRVIAKAHAAGTRVVPSLQVFAWDAREYATARALLASPGARQRLADQTAAEVVRRGVDGVNVDFEPIPAGQAAAFTDFVHRLRERLDAAGPNYQLTVAVVGHFDSYDIRGLVTRGGADAIYLMGYPYAGSWSRRALPMAPNDGVGYDVTAAIHGLLRALRPDQLIVGMPYYGHLWPTASSAPNAPALGPGSDVQYRNAIVLGQRNGMKRLGGADGVWSVFQSRDCAGCALHWSELYFDDAASYAAKWAYVKSLGLLGVGIWTLPFDGGRPELDAAMRAAFLLRR